MRLELMSPAYETDVLATELDGHLVGRLGLEPRTEG
jgi:hypothetical protein